MEYGAHLPLLAFSGEQRGVGEFVEYARAARDLGYSYLCTNDHLLFSRPWFDGLVALAATAGVSGQMRLATTIALPVVRGPVATAKALAAIDILSGGRLTVGVGPGSSARDYAAVGLDFEERWKRLDEAVPALRALWGAEAEPFVGHYYSTEGITLEPRPVQQPSPPIWVGSWGSPAGLRRVARLADGWLASGYNTTPERFAESWRAVQDAVAARGRDAEAFPNAIATMWLYVTDDRAEAERVLLEVLVPTLNRPTDELRERLPIGPPEECAEKLAAYARAGAQRIFVWPLADEIRQIEAFQERVVPLIEAMV